MAFLDIKKAFDAVNRVGCTTEFRHIIDRIKNLYEDINSRVKTQFGMTETFNIKTGLR